MDFIGIGRQSTHGPVEPKTVYFPMIGLDEEQCEGCGKIAPRATMDCFDVDEDGVPMYRCAIPCE